MLAKIVNCYDSNSWYKDCIGRIVELQDGLGSACYNTQTGRTSLSISHANDMFPWAFDNDLIAGLMVDKYDIDTNLYIIIDKLTGNAVSINNCSLLTKDEVDEYYRTHLIQYFELMEVNKDVCKD